jgi:ribonuclease P protein component
MALGRVRDQRTFRALRRSGRRGRSGPITVTALVDTAPDDGARMAFAVGRRVGPAVVRNRVRRRLRAIARDLDLAPGVYLVSAAPEAAALDFADLGRHLAAAVDHAVGRGSRPASAEREDR